MSRAQAKACRLFIKIRTEQNTNRCVLRVLEMKSKIISFMDHKLVVESSFDIRYKTYQRNNNATYKGFVLDAAGRNPAVI
jgi:hypothetical protein